MPWKVVERRIGRAGGPKQREARQRQWARRYGEDAWVVAYVLDGEVVTQDEAFERVYVPSYEQHFDQHPDELAELVATAKALRNPHAEATGSVDLQVPAVMACLHRRGLLLSGTDLVDIGSYGARSHALSVRLSPLQVKAVGHPGMSLEKFWQSKKCLAVWEDERP